MDERWIGIDFDGTLARHGTWEELGNPVNSMLRRVKAFVKKGYRVKILTARGERGRRQEMLVQDWLEKWGLPRLEVTSRKDEHMIALFDDRAIPVERDTGVIRIDPAIRNLLDG